MSEESKAILKPNIENNWQVFNRNLEIKLIQKDGSPMWAQVNAKSLYDRDGKFAGTLGMLTDITERKEAEAKLKETLDNLENLVKERTAELETAFNSLKKSEEGFAEAQKLAHIGNWDWDVANDRAFWSDELYRIFKRNPEELAPSYSEYLNYVHPDDRGYVNNALKRATVDGIEYGIDHRIILANGEELTVHINSKVILDKRNNPIRIKGTVQDITERKKTEESLLQSEKRNRLLNDSLRDAFCQVNMDGQIIDFNDIFCQMLGYSTEEVRTLTYKDLTPERWHAFEECIVREQIIPCGYSEIYEKEYRRKDGTIFPVELRTILSHDEADQPSTMWAIVRDISERKRTEEALLKSEEQYRTLFNSMVEGFCIIEMLFDEKEKPIDYIFVVTNPAFEKQTGLTNVVRKRIRELIPSNEEYWYEIYGKVALTGESVRFDNHVEGLNRWYDVYAYRIGQPINRKVAIIFNDITKRKLAEEKLRDSEEKYRNIVETANEGITIIDAEAKITYVNVKMVDLVGYSQEELIGKHIWDFNNEDDKPMAKLNMEMKRKSVNDSLEAKLIRKDGLPLWANINSKSIFDNRGVFIGAINMLTDITKRKEAEEELKNIEIARKKEIHHRIKNNLQVISSLLDLQADKFRNRKNISDSEVLEAFRESQDRVISMALIHEELYRGGGFEKLNISPYVEELSDNLLKTYSLGNKNIDLKLNLDNNVFFDMDIAVPLGMIINELVSNSFKHAFKGGDEGEIQIKLHRERNGENIRSMNQNCKSTSFALTISDNGVGIPENLDIEKLNSLGLQLVTSLVSQIDGELEIKRNKGTKFIIRFSVKEKNNQIPAPISHSIVNKTYT